MLKIICPIILMLIMSLYINNKPNYLFSLFTSALIALSFISMTLLYNPLLSPVSSSLAAIDPMSSSLAVLSIWITALMFLASFNLASSSNKPELFASYTLFLCMILVLSFSVSNIIMFFIMFESSLIPTLLIILGWGYQPERLQAGMYLMMYTICASLPLLLSLMVLMNKSGHCMMLLSTISPWYCSPNMQTIWWLTLIMAFLVKMPIYFFHLWLPKAHVEAPIAGSMILAGILLKLGGYGILRISAMSPNSMFMMSPSINAVAMWGAVITSMICLRQTDVKSLIAYSSVGHMALVIAGSSLLSKWGWQGSIAMMIAHGLCSSCLFALANMTYESTSTRSMFLTKGLLSLFPAMSLWWFMLAITNMAAPPSINLFSEISLIFSCLWASPMYLITIGLCSFLAAAYSLILYTSVNHGTLPAALNAMNLLNSRNYLIIILHFMPIIMFMAAPDLITSWL
uniref:NADH-ubiquinone oxidoreductase chain 4 n=1 Tax=Iphione sp. YZ-2018 TaxID=2153332 RepID=A0A343W6H7_9ANNE|nr:NADH dehydrogenase subunit 4 [Iphione sp. YZ-2018]